MDISILKWDTYFFKKLVAKIEINGQEEIDLNEVLAYCKTQQVKLAYIFSDCKNKGAVNKLTTSFGQPINKKLVFENSNFAITSFASTFNSAVAITTVLQAEKKQLFKRRLLKLALLAGRFSRFKMDKKIGMQKFEEMYNTWIDSILDIKNNSSLIIAENNQEVIGFIAYKTVGNINCIEFIATDEKWQQAGIGKGLMNQLFENSKQNNITQIKVVTQEENKGACNFYIACGFSIEQASSIYHLHF